MREDEKNDPIDNLPSSQQKRENSAESTESVPFLSRMAASLLGILGDHEPRQLDDVVAVSNSLDLVCVMFLAIGLTRPEIVRGMLRRDNFDSAIRSLDTPDSFKAETEYIQGDDFVTHASFLRLLWAGIEPVIEKEMDLRILGHVVAAKASCFAVLHPKLAEQVLDTSLGDAAMSTNDWKHTATKGVDEFQDAFGPIR